MRSNRKLEIITVKDKEGRYTGWLEEYPGILAQADSLEELKINIKKIFIIWLEQEDKFIISEVFNEEDII